MKFDPEKHLEPAEVVKADEAERAVKLAFLEGKQTIIESILWKFGDENEGVKEWAEEVSRSLAAAEREVRER